MGATAAANEGSSDILRMSCSEYNIQVVAVIQRLRYLAPQGRLGQPVVKGRSTQLSFKPLSQILRVQTWQQQDTQRERVVVMEPVLCLSGLMPNLQSIDIR